MKLNTPKDFFALQKKCKEQFSKPKKRIRVCCGTGCIGNGSLEVLEAFQKEIQKQNLSNLTVESVTKTGCHGFCAAGPLVMIEPDEILYCHVKVKDVPSIVKDSLLGGKIIESLLYQNPSTQERIAKYQDIPFFKNQCKVVLRNVERINPEDIQDAMGVGVYEALVRTLETKKPKEVIEEVKQSQLRGRGGAGFLTGRKWESCASTPSEERYLVCNGDEGDPGAFMDRSVMEGDPHSVIEGMLIGAYAIGAQKGFIYVRDEYPLAVTRLSLAIEQAKEYGFLGNQILGHPLSFDISVVRGAGAFVCGEATALKASIEGNVGEPRPRPPHLAQHGLWEKPTCLNNVETWVTIPAILNKGIPWFTSLGTPKSKGTKIFSLVGKVNNTGLIEVPMGIPLRKIIFDIGGGIPKGHAFKAVQTGGPSGGCLPASLLDSPVDYETLEEAGSMMGSGGMIVMDDRTCMVDMTRYFLQFLKDESCGKCLPCREGIPQLFEMVQNICRGKGQMEDLEKIEHLAKTINETSLCGLGESAGNPLLSTLRYFRDEYIAHIQEKKCPAGVCKDLIRYTISSECTGCTLCFKACPVKAIQGGKPKIKHEILQESCIRCGACFEVCPVQAVKVE